MSRSFFFNVKIGAFFAVVTAFLLSTACSGGGDNTFTDSRDNKKYRTVQIGKTTWMAENLNHVTDGSKCYANDESNCQKYGRLYDWDGAMKVCPAGWRLPTRADWNSLVEIAGDGVAGTKLKSKTDWNGTDDFGFLALPGGFHLVTVGNFLSIDSYGYWWSATEVDAGYAWYRNMYSNYEYVNEYSFSKSNGLSVRCVLE